MAAVEVGEFFIEVVMIARLEYIIIIIVDRMAREYPCRGSHIRLGVHRAAALAYGVEFLELACEVLIRRRLGIGAPVKIDQHGWVQSDRLCHLSEIPQGILAEDHVLVVPEAG